jgi:hypothetical protein
MNGKIYWFPQIASKNGKFTDGYQILWLEILKTICRVFGKNNYKTQDTNDERHLVFTMIENFTKVSKKAKNAVSANTTLVSSRGMCYRTF